MLNIPESTISAAASIANAQNTSAFSDNSSWESYGGLTNSFAEEENWANAWSRVYGTEATARDILNAYMANEMQKEMILQQQDYNATEAEKARQFQAQMSNTAYQRAVADLQKAGLNPILAVGNIGASTPQGAVASSGLGTAHKANTYANQESSSSAYGHSRSQSSGTNWGSGGSTGHSESETTTQLKELSNIIEDLTNASSGKTKEYQDEHNKDKYSLGGSKKFWEDMGVRNQHHIPTKE